MALTGTTIAAAMSATADLFTATSATGATVGGIAKIDDEYMFISGISGTLISVVRRGSFGSLAKAHNSLAPCTFGLVTDLPQPGPRGSHAERPARDLVSYPSAGAITLPTRDTVALLTNASGAAYTLADPSAAIDGVILIIVNTTAQANTVDLATGVYGSDASDVFTFAAIGQSVTLLAYKGKWAHLGASLNVDEQSGSYPTLA